MRRASYDTRRPSKHAGSDSEAFWLRPGMAITASELESGRIVRSDFPHPIRFCFFLKKAWTILCKPTRVRSGWPGQVWVNASGPEASQCARIIEPGYWKNATSPLPVSHFQTRLYPSTDGPDPIMQNQPGSDSVLADCVRFWPNGSGPEASRCARIIRTTSSQYACQLIRTGCESDTGMFTG